MHRLITALVCSAVVASSLPAGAAEAPTAEELLGRSIAFHDPGGIWGEGVIRIAVRSDLSEELAAQRGVATTVRRAVIDPGSGRFVLSYEQEGAGVEVTVAGDEVTVAVDGRTALSAEELERYGAAPPRPLVLRNYLTYLYGLPMKLRDAGANLDPVAERTTFQGEDVWALRVTYDEAVGTDTWYVYLDPQSAELVGYRFYHDEAAGDGEYIVLDGEAEDGGLRLPKVRRWYTNQGDEYLATDTLVELRVARD